MAEFRQDDGPQPDWWLALLFEPHDTAPDPGSAAWEEGVREHAGFGGKFGSVIRGGGALYPAVAATTVRVRDGQVLVTAGPFMESAAVDSGLYFLAAPDGDSAAAFADALRTWRDRGLPDNPGAWITTAARNRALDRLRRESLRGRKESDAVIVAPPPMDDETPPVADDQLRLIFTCCHPALTPQARVTLTLRLVCGLRTAEIARAFMQPEGTVAQRLTRAKSKIRIAGIPLRVPPAHLLPERLADVLACIYLMFAEGYSATAGDHTVRPELCTEAVRLGRLLCALMPDEGEAHALLALMLLNDSRRGERCGPAGELLTLEEQDRRQWDRASIDEGMSRLRRAASLGRGPYLAQAAIAARMP
ncbi:MAG: DUF6596 domain-containing protein [Mycobacterium sp.]